MSPWLKSFRSLAVPLASLAAAALLAACQAEPAPPAPPPDETPGRCTYEAAPMPAGGTGETIAPGPVRAGVGEAPLDLPVGTPLSGYTARARLLGGMAPDSRQSPHARAFAPSAGVQTRPLVPDGPSGARKTVQSEAV